MELFSSPFEINNAKREEKYFRLNKFYFLHEKSFLIINTPVN